MATVCLSNIGNTYEKMNMLDSALIIQQQARAKSLVMGMENLKSATLTRIGVVLSRLGRYNEALNYFRNALIQVKISGNKLQPSEIQYAIGNAYLSLMMKDSSLFHARLAYSNARSQSQKFNVLVASNLLVKIFRLTGKKDSIIYYQDIAAAMKDSLFGQEKLRQYQLFTLKQQQQQHKQNLDIKNKEIAISKLEVVSQRKTQIGLFFGLTLLGIIGGLLFWQNRMRKKSNTTLMVLNNQLDEANKVKAKFFGILSHDLRSPITSLINFLYLLKNEPEMISANERSSYQHQIGQSTEELLQTMETMLIWSKEQMDNFEPEIRILPVRDLFNYLQKFFAQTSQAQISFSDPEAMEVSADENYLKVIMQNLTSNAIKALRNNPAGTITWKARKVGIKTILSITDNGPGINAEQIKALYHEESVVNAKTGFGFHLIRDLAKAIKYHITIESKPGLGTTFVLSS
jgi:signal transduction histidine kinase